MNQLTLIWFGIFVLLVIIEAVTWALTTIWGAISAFLLIFLSMTGMSLPLQVIIFFAVSILLFVFTRPFALKKLKSESELQDSQIGKELKVVSFDKDSTCGSAIGRGGVTWNIKCSDENLNVNDICVVVRIDGNTLTVVKK